jgi:hypothetical protein
MPKKESRVGQSGWKKGTRGKLRAPNNSLKTNSNNRRAVENMGVHTKIGLTNDILRPLSKFATDLNDKIGSGDVTVKQGLEKHFINVCLNGTECFDNTNLYTFPALKGNKVIKNGLNSERAALCNHLKQLSSVVYKGKNFIKRRVNIMFTTMETYFKNLPEDWENVMRSPGPRSSTRRTTSTRSYRPKRRLSSTLTRKRTPTRSARSNSSGPPSNSPPPPPFKSPPRGSNSSSSTSSRPSKGVNLSSNSLNASLRGECSISDKIAEIKTALTECSNVGLRKTIIQKVLASY